MKKSYILSQFLTSNGAIAEYPASLFPVGGILWRTSQNTIEVILMQINGPGILQFSPSGAIAEYPASLFPVGELDIERL